MPVAVAAIVMACGGDDGSEDTDCCLGPTSTGSPAVVRTVEGPGSPVPSATTATDRQLGLQAYKVPSGSRPHDVAPAADGGVWYTAQGSGELGWLDPATGNVVEISLGTGSSPHGVIVGPDGAPWVTDSGLNAMVRVDPVSHEVKTYRLPSNRGNANLNTASFDDRGRVWFTGQAGVYGVLDPGSGEVRVWDAPNGRGPYGITTTPNGDVYYASLAGSYVGKINVETGEATVLRPPTSNQGARRVWTDPRGRVWVAEWNVGQVAMFDPGANAWKEWKLPGSSPSTYAVYVDEGGDVWLTDFGGNAIHRFDPDTEQFETYGLASRPGEVRQLHGRAGEVWGAESAADQIVVIRF
jgi:virginiamycin B lyase